MRALRVLLVFALLLGVVWIGQGIGLIRGSFMTGRAEWAAAGAGLAAAAVLALWWTARPRGTP